MKKNQIFALIFPAILAIILILAFADIDADVTDPWYESIQKVQQGQQLAKENPEKARELIEEGGQELISLTEKHPYHARVHHLLSYYYLTTQQFEKALKSSSEAIKLGKGGLVNQVEFEAEKVAVQAAGNLLNSIKSNRQKFTKLWEIRSWLPRNENMLIYGAQLHTQVNQLDSAMIYYEKVLNINKNNKVANENYAKLTFFYGNNLAREGNLNSAYQFYKLAQKHQPANPDYNNNLGNVALKLNKADEAVKYFQNAVKINPKNEIYKGNLQLAQNILNRGNN